MVSVTVNGQTHTFDGDSEMPLLWFLRENLNLKGTKFGCGIGQCGACTVHIDGVAVRSCIVQVSLLDGANITTIEGLAKETALHPVQQTWIDEDVPQCGYCQAGQIMAAVDFLEKYPNPSDEDINENLTNICRCGTYYRIRKAIHRAAKLKRSGM
ncbi:MAG: (2Fe-2S)-binding protein [Alphaproteobacteria bacterium]|nr:MAG: (2Fe-2S)-binding protein [Alphaproteobacteria bacterium]